MSIDIDSAINKSQDVTQALRDLETELTGKNEEIERLEKRINDKDDEIAGLEDKVRDQQELISLEDLREALGLTWDVRRDQVMDIVRRLAQKAA